MSLSGRNCNLCKNKIFIPQIGYVCFGDKFRGKPIEKDDTVCDEYEFGGFIDLEKRLKNIPESIVNFKDKLFT